MFIAPTQPKVSQLAPPRFHGFGYAGSCRSALAAGGGDLCDVVPLADTSLLLVIADVMGKGLPAALFADSLRTLIRAVAGPDVDPAECLAEVNELMFEQLSSADMFITAQLVVADLAQRQLVVGSAGHCPLLLSDGQHPTEAMAPQGMPLGIQRDAIFTSECVELEPCTSVLLYTDGLTEARNPAGKLFGQERLEHWFRRAAAKQQSAAQLKQSLLQELADFEGGYEAADDQSFLVFQDETPRPAALLPRETLRWLLPWRQSGSVAARLPALR